MNENVKEVMVQAGNLVEHAMALFNKLQKEEDLDNRGVMVNSMTHIDLANTKLQDAMDKVLNERV